MSNLAIRVQNLGKLYRLGQHIRPRTLREALAVTSSRRLHKVQSALAGNGANQAANETIWALRHVSFEIRRGETVGIIGRNGSGKSTLLKILSRVTGPTEGRVEGYGRVRSLLEVGTGFHPELTGRENIFLNGAILGMKKAEITRKFDEIVAFSEVEKFLDTPVKRYSSGMYVRLAFAVAAHLEPEILIVDEVLAVGDIAFQKKCLGKMSDVAQREGRTVLFVSHNMAAVQSLCARAFWLDAGQLADDGATQAVVDSYLQSVTPDKNTPLDQRQDRSGDGGVRLTSVSIESVDTGKVIYADSRLKVTLTYSSPEPLRYPNFIVDVYDSTTSLGLFRLSSDCTSGFPESLPAEGQVTCLTDPLNLTPGRCYVSVGVQKGPATVDYIQRAAYFDVEDKAGEGIGKTPHRDWVLTTIEHEWLANGDRPDRTPR